MSIEQLIEDSTESVARLMRKGHVIAVASSFGKDSVCCVLMTIAAAKRVKNEGIEPKILVMFGDTGVENPENLNYAMKEMSKLQLWASNNTVDLTCYVSRPSLAASFPVRVLGGRALPSFPGTNHDCSTEWKIAPAQRLRKQVLGPIMKSGIEPVTIVGTRFDESEARNRRMQERGDSSTDPVRNKDGELVLSVIAEWLTDEVWEVIALAGAGEIETFSDFEDTFRLYADAGGTSCAVVSDAIMAARPKQGCGARQGCHTCTAVSSDSSMENFIAGDARYAYMKPLNDIRNFIAATRWDLSRRLWVGRSIIDGYISIGPDVYSPNMMRELFRYYVTADRDEYVRARKQGEEPKFQVISLETAIAIDAMWSLQGYHKPHTAIMDFNKIRNFDASYYVPKDVPVAIRPPKMPKPKYYYVGDEWDEGLNAERGNVGWLNGLRDPILELVNGSDGFRGCMGTRTLSNGNVVMDVETSDSFDVDSEGAELAMMFMDDDMLESHTRSNGKTGLTAGYRFWVGLGTISLSPQQVSMHDGILRRTAFKERHGIAGPDVNLEDLLSRCVDSKVIPEETKLQLEADVPDVVEMDDHIAVVWKQTDMFAMA